MKEFIGMLGMFLGVVLAVLFWLIGAVSPYYIIYLAIRTLYRKVRRDFGNLS